MLRACAPLSRRHLARPVFRCSSNLGRSYATVVDTANLTKLPEPGLKLNGFTLKRAKHVPELELSALQFKHDKTGADYIHVAREDKNNVFSIGFKVRLFANPV